MDPSAAGSSAAGRGACPKIPAAISEKLRPSSFWLTPKRFQTVESDAGSWATCPSEPGRMKEAERLVEVIRGGGGVLSLSGSFVSMSPLQVC
jgi:hypothetical protein